MLRYRAIILSVLLLIGSIGNTQVLPDPNAAVYGRFVQSQNISADDNVSIPIFTVTLATNNTGCAIHSSYTYIATNNTNIVLRAGIIIWVFINQNGTLIGNNSSIGEVIIGTGCPIGCDSYSVTINSTTATTNVKFNNTLSVIGTYNFRVLNSTCSVAAFT